MPMHREIVIRGVIGWDEQATPEYLQAQLNAAGMEHVLVLINSPGGYVFDGLEMANMLSGHSAPVTVRVTGLAASMATYIAVRGGKLEVEDNAVFMIHNPSTIAWGDHREMSKTAKLLNSLTTLIARAYASKTGKSVEEMRGLMDDETWLFGEEIRTEGFADETIIAGEGPENKAVAMESAHVELLACAERLKEYVGRKPSEKIAALLTPEIENKPEEVVKMDLTQFLKENPEAQAEYDAALAQAAKPGGDVIAALKAAQPVLDSAEYPDIVKSEVLAQVVAGSLSGMNAIVSMHDRMTEAKKSEEAKDDKTKEVAPENPAKDGNERFISDPEDIAGEVERIKD